MYITQNPALRSLAGLRSLWLAPAGVNYFPVTFTVQWIQWHLWGNSTLGYHLTNLGLHLLGSLLLWGLLRRIGLPLAWLAGLLFALHPLAVESVAWISEFKNTLSLPLLLGASWAYVAYDDLRRPSRYLLALLLFACAMLSKSTVAMFPVVLLLYVWWKRARIRPADITASLPFFAIAGGLGVVTVWFEHHRASMGPAMPEGWLHRLAAAGTALGFYFEKALVPVNLQFNYPRWPADPASVWPFLPWVLLAALFAWCWSHRNGWGRAALLGLGFFVLNLLPVIGLVPMAYLRISRVADHFGYLPGRRHGVRGRGLRPGPRSPRASPQPLAGNGGGGRLPAPGHGQPSRGRHLRE